MPCSGLGVIRKKPDIRYKPLDGLSGLPAVQKRILDNVSRYVRPGGVLVYSTCTVLSRENSGVVRTFMDRLLEDYREVMSGDIHALFKMKELWIYLAPSFTNYEKYLKKIKKTNKLSEYQAAVAGLFANETLV